MNPILLAVLKLLMPIMTWVLALMIPRRNRRLALQETLNKLDIMELVTKVSSILPKGEDSPPLKTLVDKCYALGEFSSLFLIEGLGQRTIENELRLSDSPQSFLTRKGIEDLPNGSLPMLHAGIGLGFAKHGLDGLKKSGSQALTPMVSKFIEHCRTNSQPGYFDCAIESLGLVARFEHDPKMVLAIDQVLADINPELRGLLWHGAGRAVYFSPQNFIASAKSPVPAFSMCRLEPPHEIGKQNMIAGLAWAITLVNMKTPEIIEEILILHAEDIRGSQDAFKNGIASSILVREVITPRGSRDFIEAVSEKSAGDQTSMLAEFVLGPAEKALNIYLPGLVQQDRLGQVFQYQELVKFMP